MSQKASRYVSKGLRSSKTVLKESRGGFFKYFAFTMASVFGKLFFLTYPLFALADYHMAAQLEETKTMHVEKSFEDSGSNAKYMSTAQYALMHKLVLFTGILILAVLAFGFIQIGAIIDQYFDFERSYTLFVFQIVSGCVLIIFVIQKNMYFAPVVYLIQSSEGTRLSEALTQSVRFMSKNNKAKLLYIHLYYLSRLAIYISIAALLAYGSYLVVSVSWFVVIGVALFALLLMFIPRIALAHKISTAKLFKDISIEASYENLRDTQIEDSLQGKVAKDEVLLRLFDEFPTDDKRSNLKKNRY